MTHAERATDYARRVVGGDVPACEWVRRACQRHLDDLEGDAYRYDHDKANRVCQFLELLPHIKGRWALRHERLKLEDWQCFVVCSVFGWLRPDGMRRFRVAYIEVPRKNAKSTLAAGLGLYMLTADGEYGAEVYSGATSEKQAWEVFGPARKMADKTPGLQMDLDVSVHAKSLSVDPTGSKFEPVIGNPGDGASPHCAITDEYHEHRTDAQYDTMKTGMGSREQPLSLVITTAGDDTAGPCYSLRSQVTAMLNGTVPDPELFGAVWTIDEGDDWTNPEILVKANPNYDVSVFGEYLQSQQREAVNHARKQASFKTKHLNVWVTARNPYFNLEKWLRLGDNGFDVADHRKSPCYAAMDLSSKVDLTSVVRVFRREVDGDRHYYVTGRHYLPEDRIEEVKGASYRQWAIEGHLTPTDGNVIDPETIQADIRSDDAEHGITEARYDPWGATDIALSLQKSGIRVVEVPQRVAHLSEPMKWVAALIDAGRIHHDGNPVLSWAIGNVVAKEDANENVFPRKEFPEKKIDPAVALIMAMSGALAADEAPSAYAERGFRVL